jgi:hypothetical protein
MAPFDGSISYKRGEGESKDHPLPQHIIGLDNMMLRVTTVNGLAAAVVFIGPGSTKPMHVPEGITFVDKQTQQPVQLFGQAYMVTYSESYEMKILGAFFVYG